MSSPTSPIICIRKILRCPQVAPLSQTQVLLRQPQRVESAAAANLLTRSKILWHRKLMNQEEDDDDKQATVPAPKKAKQSNSLRMVSVSHRLLIIQPNRPQQRRLLGLTPPCPSIHPVLLQVRFFLMALIPGSTSVYIDPHGVIYDATLNKTDIAQNVQSPFQSRLTCNRTTNSTISR